MVGETAGAGAARARRLLGGVLLALMAAPAAFPTRCPAGGDVVLPGSSPAGSDRLLSAIVRDGWVDYALLQEHRGDLRTLLARIGAASPSLIAVESPSTRLAFYINAYNLATLDLIARERAARRGKLKSIQEIPAAWTRPKWTVAGAARTLDEIEHEIIRKEFREPRIHMALVCASVSCPALRPEAYAGPRLEEQLEDASQAFLNDATRNQLAPRDGAVRLSKIFDWYGSDFVGVYRDSALERLYGEKEGAVLAFAARYVPEETSAAWKAKRLKIEYLPYDWALNDWSRNAAPAAKR